MALDSMVDVTMALCTTEGVHVETPEDILADVDMRMVEERHEQGWQGGMLELFKWLSGRDGLTGIRPVQLPLSHREACAVRRRQRQACQRPLR